MKQISESKQKYIKTISKLMENNNGTVRKTDIANALGYSKASVTCAIRRLEQDGYVILQNRNILFTELGKELSEELYEKKVVLAKFFELLGDEKEDAVENSSRMEMIISENLFSLIKETLKTEVTAYPLQTFDKPIFEDLSM